MVIWLVVKEMLIYFISRKFMGMTAEVNAEEERLQRPQDTLRYFKACEVYHHKLIT